METKKGGLKKIWDSFVGISTVVWQLLGGLKKFKMVTKVQKMLDSLQSSQIFAVMYPVTSTSSGTRLAKKIGIGRTNFAAVAMELKKGGF
jgi:hypothetical protein